MAPALIFIHPNPQPLQHPKKASWEEIKVTGGSHPCSLHLCRLQQTPAFPAWLALCHHGLLTVTKPLHKPRSTRASPGLHFARHKHLMGISGVSNPSCSVGGVRSFLSTHTLASRQGLGGKWIYSLFILLSSILTAIMEISGAPMEIRQFFFPFYQSHTPICPLNPQPRDPPDRDNHGAFHLGAAIEPPGELPEQSFGLEQRQFLKPQSREAVT